MPLPVLALWLLVTIPIAVHGYCVESLTGTLLSVEGQPLHSSVGFSPDPLPVCNSDRFTPSGTFAADTGAAPSCFCFALPGS